MSILFEAVEPMHQIVQHFNRYDEDSIDRLNHKYSTIVFCILGIVVTTNLYVGELIKCWSPAQFPESWTDYTNSICWISNTYYIPMEELDIIKSPRKEIVYYQWVPLVLFLQAFLFYLPFVHWKVMNSTTGININKIAGLLRSLDQLNPENRDHNTRFITLHLERTFNYTRDFRNDCCSRMKHKMAECGCFCGKRHGNFLIATYLLTKFFYLANAVLQLYALNPFLGTDYTLYGIEALQDLTSHGDTKPSVRFPRVTLCDFSVRALGRPKPFTVQCTLPVNLFNEKIFIFVWFWLVLMALLNLCSILYWMWVGFASNRKSYIKNYLKIYNKYKKERDRHRLIVFCNHHLRQDGFFLLKMISKNTNELVTAELVRFLWDGHNKIYEQSIRKQQV